MEFKEIKIPVPWGHVAGKSCGNEEDDCVIAIHGYQDNANSFNNLIPLLPKSFYYISIDLPGHGKSSPFDLSLITTRADFLLALKLILDYLNRKQYIFLAHSFGSQTAIFFTHIYPEYVSKLISLDGLIFMPRHTQTFIPSLKKYINNYPTLRKFTMETAPAYTIEEAVQRMRNGRAMYMKEETGRMLAERTLLPVGDGKYKLTTAQFLKYCMPLPLTLKQLTFIIKNYPIHCPHLFIMADQSEFFFQMIGDSMAEFKKNKYFEIHTVEGSHDVHMEEAEKVAPIISKFLVKNVHKL